MKTHYNKHTKQVWMKRRFGTVAYILNTSKDSAPVELHPILPTVDA